jgi:hypothetical protein
MFSQLGETCIRNGIVDESRLNFMLSSIKGFKPQNQGEAMLACEMAGVHFQMMTFSRKLADARTAEEINSVGGILNKLARTFAAQIEVLHRCRSSIEQRINVQNVSVSGGQAVVTQNAVEDGKDRPANALPAITDARSIAMPILEESAPLATSPPNRKARR